MGAVNEGRRRRAALTPGEFHWEWPILEVLNVVDGDTVDLVFDRGFGGRQALRVRLMSIDAYELRGPKATEKGREADAFVEDWLDGRRGPYVLVSKKGAPGAVGIGDGSFGRWAGIIFDAAGVSLGDDLLTAGLAVLSE